MFLEKHDDFANNYTPKGESQVPFVLVDAFLFHSNLSIVYITNSK